jgi:hypothetical protein
VSQNFANVINKLILTCSTSLALHIKITGYVQALSMTGAPPKVGLPNGSTTRP